METIYAPLWPRERKALSRYRTVHIDHSGEIEWPIVGLLVILLLALIFAGTIVFHYPVATAADYPSGVLTKNEACRWQKVSGEIIGGRDACV